MTLKRALLNNLQETHETTVVTWPNPVPFSVPSTSARPYPVDALPARIREAVCAYQSYGQQPLPLIACSALANVSLACQTLANVARDHLLTSPVSLYFLIVAASGERKSAADSTFSQATRAWQAATRAKREPEVKAAHTLHQLWETEKNALLKQIKRCMAQPDKTDPDGLGGFMQLDAFKKRFTHLMQEEPHVPLLPLLFFEDATQEALASHLATGWPSASLWSDEGALVVGGQGMQNNVGKFVALLNRLWDGNPFVAHRKSADSFVLENRRLTVSLMLQPLILQQMLARQDGISRQSGFLARSLLTYPESAMGKRFYQAPPHNLSALQAYGQRLTECLDASVTLDAQGCHALPVLQLSFAAKHTWVRFFNHVERGLSEAREWHSIKDFASKAAENAVRLAALFHLFEGHVGDIATETMEQAMDIIHWHLTESRRLLDHTQTASFVEHDAIRLMNWLVQKLQSTKDPPHPITLRYLQQYSPLREKQKLLRALEALSQHHVLRLTTQHHRVYIEVNPHLLIRTA